MIRLFVAIAIPPELTARLAPLAGGIPGARWVPARNLHLTLRFIGEVDEGRAEDLDAALTGLDFPAFELTLATLGTFGHRRPHTLWAGVAPEPRLDRLQAKVEAAAVGAGLAPEPRKFTPHVTLARLGAGAAADRVRALIAGNSPFRAGPLAVRRITLFQSHLTADGPEYQMLAEYPLGDERPA